jgi:hypothetical protein
VFEKGRHQRARLDVQSAADRERRVAALTFATICVYEVLVYRVEGGPPNALFRQGWRKDSLHAGDEVTVKGIRAKGATSMNVGQATITKADGRRMFGTGGNRAASAEPTPQQ